MLILIREVVLKNGYTITFRVPITTLTILGRGVNFDEMSDEILAQQGSVRKNITYDFIAGEFHQT